MNRPIKTSLSKGKIYSYTSRVFTSKLKKNQNVLSQGRYAETIFTI